MDEDKIYEGESVWRLSGYPIRLWVIALGGFLGLTVLLIFLMYRIGEEPLQFKLPADFSTPATEQASP
ncbi:MAG: hypothetical protein KDH09_13555 [Chrysiogenetes bacterium]|nr:hypothetical protein [Chrysiogenetes bacterium]